MTTTKLVLLVVQVIALCVSLYSLWFAHRSLRNARSALDRMKARVALRNEWGWKVTTREERKQS